MEDKYYGSSADRGNRKRRCITVTLRQAMDKRKITSETLSQKLGIDFKKIRGFRTWKMTPNEKEKKAIAEALGLDFSDLNWSELKRANGILEKN